MSKWSGSTYLGPKKNDWEDGFGNLKFPNGVIYEGNFTKGEFHGDGTLIYPNGVSIRKRYKLGSLCCQVGQRKTDRWQVFLLRQSRVHRQLKAEGKEARKVGVLHRKK